ncbi:glutamate synthase-related protein [Frigoriglobus tundricola]|uniref:Glutamate synthase [NADPH] large chain n=1 Tax=Frigoriglobus tundricola TaxID=2774151 RepID=A0A6M5Z3B5_9BACT|nr:glutamate synthase-related protein [Frigoriglobus tundricola]QJX00586.1 Glutamate synthase [NADPH] large chain [Frigoriglobus tundricola]
MNATGLDRVRSGKLLYTDEVGHDACGIGGVAARDGKPSAEVMRKTVLALKAMEHRGGVCGEAGDGAGVLVAIPQAFFREEAKRLRFDGARDLRPEDTLAVGVLFVFEYDPARAEQVRAIVRDALTGGPVRLIGTRTVPTNEGALPAKARATRPAAIEHFVFKVEGDATAADQWLALRRLGLRQRLLEAGLSAYVPSLSARLVGYKGLMTSGQLADFYADLTDPAFETGIATFHRRYSTNTFPNWTLAQPFRLTCHNGEINTVKTTRNAVTAFARGLRPPLPGGDLLTPKMSDSSSLDEWVEYLMLQQNWSLLRALRLSVPPVWDTEADVWGQEAFDLFTYYRRTFGSLTAWDGPAGIIGTDGRMLVGLVDRMGLRPVRWCSDKRGWLYIGSESGVFGLDTTTIVASGQLQPGQMIALDTATGERLDSYQIMARVVAEARDELGDVRELNRRQIIIPEGFDYTRQTDDAVGAMLTERNWSLDHLLQAAGWDFDRAVFVREMAKLKKEPLSSMGHDRVLTVFSQHHPTLFKYLQQTFAEVTNPPIDPYREGGAMSLATYLGRGPLASSVREGAGDALPVRQMELPSPVISDAIVEEIRQNEVLGFKLLDATFPIQGGADAMRASLVAIQSAAEKAVHDGYHVLCVSDKEACKRGIFPIPSLLALGAVHQYLCQQGLRDKCSLIVQAGDIQEGHDVCCLVAFGADAVHPYLMLRLVKDGLTFKDPDSKNEFKLEPREALENLFAALEDTIKKVISKMGITTIEGYRGAQLFEAVGFGPQMMAFLGDFPSRLGGIGFTELVEDAQWRVAQAEKMTVLGRNRDYHAFNAKVRMALRDAVKEAHPEPEQGGGEMAYTAPPAESDPAAPQRVADKFVKFTDMVNTRVPTVLRDLFTVKPGTTATPLNEVQAAADIIANHFRGAAMSHGALTGASHMTIAAALNEMGGLSNSGEGGEARWRNDIPERAYGAHWDKVRAQREAHPEIYALGGNIAKSRFRSRIRQIASGRFGVDAEYLVNADEISIKMAQGAKPGEGGQLMGKKVTTEIAEIRFAKPGTDLISPPPHHDIYSIEDLAQLIYDLKAVKPGIPVSVKLVAVENIGTIAVGVAKAGADIIEIDGIDGGTGAAMVSSKEHAGLPSEMGLAEAHQALVVNGLRTSVVLRVGGGIKNGHDVVKYALFGADEFTFGQGLMVSVGCIVCKSCHIPNCPTGITGSPEIFKGHPEHTKAYLTAVAIEVRALLARMGFKRLSEVTGRSDLLTRRTDFKKEHSRAALLDLSRFIHPDMAVALLAKNHPQVEPNRGLCAPAGSLNERVLAAAFDAIDTAQNADLVFRVRNSDRAVGATVAGEIAKLYGREGMPNNRKVKVRLDGEAGQSFGAWCINGLDLELRGFAQDGVAKGISGGTVVVTLDYSASDYGGEIQSVAGNNVGYGATGGTVFVGGRAGHRLGIRNSGATIVAEAAGKYACEYMTRGRVLILGPVENEIGSGMTGGELFIYDPKTDVPAKLHGKSVTVIECSHVDYEWMHPLLHQYFARTGSRQAEYILKNWADVRRGRRLRKVLPLAVARAMEDLKTAGTNAG